MTIRLNNYVGCYEDKRHRILSNKQTNDKKMTISKCKAICRRYKYYGLEIYIEILTKKNAFVVTSCENIRKSPIQNVKCPVVVTNQKSVEDIGEYLSINFVLFFHLKNISPRSILVFYTESSSTSYISNTLSVIRLNNYELSLTSIMTSDSYLAIVDVLVLLMNSNILIQRNHKKRKKRSLQKLLNKNETLSLLPEYIGCFEDKRKRILDGKMHRDKRGMTIAKCKALCHGNTYYGLENKHECFCGKSLRKYKKQPESACKMPCSGNRAEKCGGHWRISVYKCKYVLYLVTEPDLFKILVLIILLLNVIGKETMLNENVFHVKFIIKVVFQCCNTKVLALNTDGKCGKCHPLAKCRKNGRCKCKRGYYGDGVNSCESSESCLCMASGDPHYKTFDGQMIHFMGTCKYTLSKSLTINDECAFNIEVKNEHRRNNKRVAYTRLVDLTIYGKTIRVGQGGHVFINHERKYLPVKTPDSKLRVFNSGKYVQIWTKCGIEVNFDGNHAVSVVVPAKYKRKMTGLCGDCNGRRDDFRTKEGKDVTNAKNRYTLIGNSFAVEDDSDITRKRCKSENDTFTCEEKVKKLARTPSFCAQLQNQRGPFGECIKKNPDLAKEYFTSCVLIYALILTKENL
ncbi:hypothetical protein KUTeg_011853 [Tegillarca granosa]|uniref:Zonadhesin n=1 Tax=Tegillarca granosa TaxID=220873 RepID=A0ABQ9F349_TEGGR|nr:hypothetical protein KUTeg_011853 [Tegillarca granosa]